LAVIVAPTTLVPAFGRPVLHDQPPGDLLGPVIDYSMAQFVGFRVDQPRIHPGNEREFTLCWQAPDGADEIPVPYAFALHVVGPDDQLVGRRESYPGLGNYTLWQPGRAFCDTFALPIEGSLEPGRIYRLALTLLEFETQRRLPDYAPDGGQQFTTFIGSLISPAEPVSAAEMEAAPFRFEGIALVNYTLALNGDALQLEITWGTQIRPGRTYKLFVHVFNAQGERVLQADPLAGGERYPTWAWERGERIADSVTLSVAGLPPSEYRVMVGLYDAETLTRLPATDAGGQPAPDNAALLEIINLE
jgi:hypothetical protein